jgi:hypothetical protein
VGTWENLPEGQPWPQEKGAGYKYFTDTTVRHVELNELSLTTKVKENWNARITMAEMTPTEVVTGYGIWKTTEDKVPMVVQRRHAQKTAYVWAVSLDDSHVSLQVSFVKSGDQALDQSQALIVQAVVTKQGSAIQNWSLLANPQSKKVIAKLSDGANWESDAVFSVR